MALLVSDSFDRSSGPIGSTDGGVLGPRSWISADSWVTNGTQGRNSDNRSQTTIVVDALTPDVDIEVDIATRSPYYEPGIAFRWHDSDNYLLATLAESATNNDCALWKCSGGAFTLLATLNPAGNLPSTLYAFRVEAHGPQVEILRNGSTVVSHTLSTGDQTLYGSNTRHGIRSHEDTGSTFDNFKIWGDPPSAAWSVGMIQW